MVKHFRGATRSNRNIGGRTERCEALFSCVPQSLVKGWAMIRCEVKFLVEHREYALFV
eukprot:CAMPEP_0171664380 /NCGR_PEP_ID=MMETSP0990-20121206/46746_1 /TAXON_ID=483369 /ORGANISM="non described non described, Strain CCMP2098" /LENGTH=57 /DNA_ID=CAMNT_0012247241 /DNA_START=373 /DNA_END=546 /DNA_ORIENTATION=+